jgi:hypothetical protein
LLPAFESISCLLLKRLLYVGHIQPSQHVGLRLTLLGSDDPHDAAEIFEEVLAACGKAPLKQLIPFCR